VLAEDHREMRRGVRLPLESERDLEVVAEADDLRTARHLVQEHVPDVLLLFLRQPNGSGIELIERLRAEAPGTAIVVETTEDSPVFARRALDAGAIGYVLKDNAHDERALMIRAAMRGRQYVSPGVAAGLDAFRRAGAENHLSERETEITRLIALGHTSAEIAALLHLSRRTVETHRARVHDKLGLARRWQVVQYALARHLIGPDPPPRAASENDND
jgi:two-component system, NarL family, response regulator NreC